MSEPKPKSRQDAAAEREERLALAVAEFLDLCATSESVDREEFLRRYSDLEPQLGSLLGTIERIDRCLETLPENPPADEAEPVPERLSGHRILGVLGSGGMGRVLLGLDEGLGRKVAIKTLSPRYRNDATLRTRFMQEARAMARVVHPHVARIYNLGQADEIPHFVMEYVEGSSLTEAARPLALRQRVELFLKVAAAVDFLHRSRIVHRDLKPANILVGRDLEPKLLDFGLARQVGEDAARLTRAGDIMGTPDYLSPEQARGEATLDARSDVFSLGVMLYELLTDALPFRAETLAVQVRAICEGDPVLPRRLNASVPGELQHVCMKALEKRPEERYATARELAEDLERFLASEPVLASPTSYSRMLTGKIEAHLRELSGWRQDRLLADHELDAFHKLYGRLVEREDAWILEVRRLSLSQVTLYLGAWVLVVGAALVLLFEYPRLSGNPAVALLAATSGAMLAIGAGAWKGGQKRIALAYLLAFTLLVPTLVLVATKEWHLLTGWTRGDEKLELFRRMGMPTTNAQMWWALASALPAAYGLRRFTRASVFSLASAVMAALLAVVTLLRLGMLDWLEDDPGKLYFRLLPLAALFFAAGGALEHRRCADDARYFYPVAVVFTFAALSGLAAFHKPYAEALERIAPASRGQIEYLFIVNAAIYLALQSAAERFGSAQMRTVAKTFRFVIPGHVLTSLLLLGLAASRQWDGDPASALFRREARFFELVLPAAACAFVFGSVPKQMKNFLATGLLFLAVGLVRLEQDLFKERAAWPIALVAAGLLLMVVAANFTAVKLALGRWTRRRG